MLKKLNYYMTLPYTIDVVYEESGEAPPYVARILELPGCIAQGRSHNEAVRELREAQALFVEAMLESHVPIPEPAYTAEATVTKATVTKVNCAFSMPESHLSTSPPTTSRFVPA